MALIQILYADCVLPPICDVLCDLDIVPTAVSSDDIATLVDYRTMADAVDDITDEHNVRDVLTIFDKLAMSSIVDTVLKWYIEPTTPSTAVIINHALRHVTYKYRSSDVSASSTGQSADKPPMLYTHSVSALYTKTSAYDVLYNHNSLVLMGDIQCSKAIKNGMIIKNARTYTQYRACCTSLVKLDVIGNKNITSCAPFAETLRELDASNNECGINDDGLRLCTKLEKLWVTNNSKVTDCTPFAKSLKVLYAESGWSDCAGTNHGIIVSERCGISDSSLSACTAIEELHAYNNDKITTCAPFAYTLKILAAPVLCGIADNGLTLCTSIEQLLANSNDKITTCAPFARTLKILNMAYMCGIGDDGLQLCDRIEELDARCNPKITTCAPFARTLKILAAQNCGGVRDNCGIGDDGLKACINIENLGACGNYKITTCVPFADTLKILDASNCGISDDGLRSCYTIENFCINTNLKITTCAPFARSLKILYLGSGSGINDSGLKLCHHIGELYLQDVQNIQNVQNVLLFIPQIAPQITTCAPFAKSLRILHTPYWECGMCTAGLLLCHSLIRLCTSGNPKIDVEYIKSRNKNLVLPPRHP